MHSAEAVITIDSDWVDDLALAFNTVDGSSFDSDVHINEVLDTDELVERKLTFGNLRLVVLLHSSCIDLFRDDTKGVKLSIFVACQLEIGKDERELSKLRLSLVCNSKTHALENGRLMKLVTLHDGCLVVLFDLRVEVSLSIAIELPDVNTIVLSG